MAIPALILLDAAGTLIAPRQSVGETYSRIAADYGIQTDPQTVQSAFVAAFRRQPPMICPSGLSTADLRHCERLWWRRLVAEVFGAAARNEPGFDLFFGAVFEHFRRPETWRVFAEVPDTLAALRQQRLRLAVISNFDSRLDDLLAGLGLIPYFDAVHISTRLGAAKPDAAIFEAALKFHRLDPSAAWHVGDSLREDVEGAENAGLRAIWLDRNNIGLQNDSPTRITRLNQLLELIQ